MMEPPERLPDRDKAIEAMLPNVPFDGWTTRALKAGLRDAGMPADEADLLFRVRADGQLAAVTQTGSPAPQAGDTTVSLGPVPVAQAADGRGPR